MTEMMFRTALGEKILNHWRDHCPQMVLDLERKNRLDQSLFETQERAGDLMYELVSVQKMDHQAAWELIQEEWALPPEENRQESKSGDIPPSATLK